jgi:hypothetical protein
LHFAAAHQHCAIHCAIHCTTILQLIVILSLFHQKFLGSNCLTSSILMFRILCTKNLLHTHIKTNLIIYLCNAPKTSIEVCLTRRLSYSYSPSQTPLEEPNMLCNHSLVTIELLTKCSFNSSLSLD